MLAELRKLAVVLVFILGAAGAHGETILLPVVVSQSVRGAFGSEWVTRLAVLNTGSTPVDIQGGGEVCSNSCIPHQDTSLFPNQTLLIAPFSSMEVPGRLIHVDTARAADLSLNLRVQDLSRQSGTWGTEVPTVRESTLRTGSLELLIVPSTGDFRSLVRIYDFHAAAGHAATVRVYRPQFTPAGATQDQLLRELTVPLRVPSDPALYPGYADIDINGLGLPAVGTSASVNPVRIEIAPATSDVRLWAFASVTNNATQHVTLVTP